jgi:hypothetical protein
LGKADTVEALGQVRFAAIELLVALDCDKEVAIKVGQQGFARRAW